MRKLLIITDLDASLLRDDYTYEEAKPVLQKLQDAKIPLILNSSKTVAELANLAFELQSLAPIVAENGGAVCIHKESPLPKPSDCETYGDYAVIPAGMTRGFVLEQAHRLRQLKGFHFEGFDDWSDRHLSVITGLDVNAAGRARQRYVTEPILWRDSEQGLVQFTQLLAEHSIQVIRGGKFLHLMGNINKADGALLATRLYSTAFPDTQWHTVAIGDSENDLQMLEQADTAIVIPHKGSTRIHPNNANTMVATKSASAGWAECVDQLLHNFQQSQS